MRIISGKYRGKKLFSPSDDRVRPTTDRIKETIFNMLQFRLADAAVLDLFGGSGALAVECISRGASSAEVVDNSIDSIALIRRNLEGIEGDISIVSSDAFSYLERTNKKFDLIFLDPPYNKGLGNKALEIIFRRGILDHGGTVIFEHETGEEIEFYSTLSEGYFLDVKKKKMGSTTVDFIRRGSVAIVAGSFDPFTVGHRALVDYATERYTYVVVACMVNDEKDYLFDHDTRFAIVDKAVGGKRGIKVVKSEGMTYALAQEFGADTLVRGYRDEKDLAYEKEMEAFNEAHGIKTDLIRIEGFESYSSTHVRENLLKGDFSGIPSSVKEIIADALKKR